MTRVPTTSSPTIVDQWGRAFAAPSDPLRDVDPERTARVVLRDIPNLAITGDWTPEGIKVALNGHKIGQFLGSADLIDDALGDDRIQATLGSRTGALFGRPVVHKRSKADKEKEVLGAWVDQWKSLGSHAELSEIKRWSIMAGFGLAEILWDTTVTPWRQYLKPWNPRYCFYRWDIRRYVVSTQDGQEVIEPGAGKWFLHAPYGPYRGWMHGAIRAVADKWLIKQYAWRDWARFNERHGLPIIKAYVPAAGDSAQKAAFIQSMATLGQEAVIGLPVNVDGTKYDADLMEAVDRAWAAFPGAIDRADTSIVLTIKWQNLTTEVKEGSFAAARVHGDVEQVAVEFDDATLSEDLYRQVARPFAAFNYGDPELAPRTHWNVKPVEDYVQKGRVMQSFAMSVLQMREAGIQIENVRLLARRFGLNLGRLSAVDPLVGGGGSSKSKGGDDDVEAAIRNAWRNADAKERRRIARMLKESNAT